MTPLDSYRAYYRPGSVPVVVSPAGLVASALEAERAAALWDVLESRCTLTDLLETLLGDEQAVPSGLIAVGAGETGPQALVMGPLTLTVSHESGTRRVDGDTPQGWAQVDLTHADVISMELEEPDPSTCPLPIRSGAVLASTVELRAVGEGTGGAVQVPQEQEATQAGPDQVPPPASGTPGDAGDDDAEAHRAGSAAQADPDDVAHAPQELSAPALTPAPPSTTASLEDAVAAGATLGPEAWEALGLSEDDEPEPQVPSVFAHHFEEQTLAPDLMRAALHDAATGSDADVVTGIPLGPAGTPSREGGTQATAAPASPEAAGPGPGPILAASLPEAAPGPVPGAADDGAQWPAPAVPALPAALPPVPLAAPVTPAPPADTGLRSSEAEPQLAEASVWFASSPVAPAPRTDAPSPVPAPGGPAAASVADAAAAQWSDQLAAPATGLGERSELPVSGLPQPEPPLAAAPLAQVHQAVVPAAQDSPFPSVADVPMAAVPVAQAVPYAHEPAAQPVLGTDAALPQPRLADQPGTAPALAPPRSQPEPSPVPEAASGSWIHDGATVSSRQLRALHASQAASSDHPTQFHPTTEGVLAIICPAGHASSAAATRCRVCRVPLTSQPERVRPPVLADLSVNGGAPVPVDDCIVIGRAPRATPGPGQATPQLLVVPSADKSVSKNHCRVYVEGWSVLVEDMGSVNGTYLLRPGATAHRLASHSPQVLEIGDTLSLADEVNIVVEAHHD